MLHVECATRVLFVVLNQYDGVIKSLFSSNEASPRIKLHLNFDRKKNSSKESHESAVKCDTVARDRRARHERLSNGCETITIRHNWARDIVSQVRSFVRVLLFFFSPFQCIHFTTVVVVCSVDVTTILIFSDYRITSKKRRFIWCVQILEII